ncbi:MAG: DUF58 domain-containing protein [Actinobacteria bacterium]|nr:DUF58 domain-containing protein [Actinomycetota bacterium]
MKRFVPTRRAFIVAGIGVMLFMAASTAQAGWLFVLAASVLGLVATSLLWRHNLGAAAIERRAPRRTCAGDPVAVGLTIHNRGRRTLPLMRVEDHFAAFEPTVVTAERLRPGERSEIELVKTAHRRGVFTSGAVLLTSGAPFGFMRSRKAIEVPGETTVVPHWADLGSFPILEPSSFPADVLHERARTGAGQEYLGVREYRPGDPQRAVHWRSTARVGELVVREFEEEVQSRVTLILAGKDVGDPPDSAFEMLVSAAASIGIYALNTGHPVDLLRPLPEGVAHLGDPDRYDILDWLAAAEPIDSPVTPLVSQALARVGRRGTVVVLIPTLGEAARDAEDAVRMIQAAGSRAIVVAARASSWYDDVRFLDFDEGSSLQAMSVGRTAVRVVSRGEDLAECLG